MKRFILASFAVALAIGFSAFTPSKKTDEVVYYFIDNVPQMLDANPCPTPGLVDCTVVVGGQERQLYHDLTRLQPVKWDGL